MRRIPDQPIVAANWVCILHSHSPSLVTLARDCLYYLFRFIVLWCSANKMLRSNDLYKCLCGSFHQFAWARATFRPNHSRLPTWHAPCYLWLGLWNVHWLARLGFNKVSSPLQPVDNAPHFPTVPVFLYIQVQGSCT
jgi:hypothetical protein